jgi:transposase InsO family protein
MIDKKFVERNNLSFTPASGVVELADATSVATRIGFLSPPISVVIHPPGTVIQHAFEVFNLRAATYPYDFLIGRDLQSKLFRRGDHLVLPLMPSNSAVKPVYRQCVAVPTPVQPSRSADDDFIEVKHEIEPEEGVPERAKLSTPEALAAEYEAGRLRVLEIVREELEKNSKITGFCSLPESRVTLRLKPGAEEHLNQRQYPIPQKLVEKAIPKFEKWKIKARIMRAPPGCRFNNPITIQPKKDENGAWFDVRICFDGRRINRHMETDDKFPIPRIQDVLESLAGCPIYGQFDLEDCYLQFELAPESREYTAFTFQGEQWMFCGAIYGIKPLAGHLQRLISRLLRGIARCFPYFDNIPFGSFTWEQHAEQALIILRRLNAANLKVKPSSVQIGHAVMDALGHTLSAAGIGIAADKLDSVLTWEPPRTGKDMASFLGFIGFISQHVRHFGELTSSFHELKKLKASPIEWTPELLQRFETLKHAIKAAPFLAAPDFARAFYIACDASNAGIGGVLYQPTAEAADDDITPYNIVLIFSRKLNETQQRYHPYKKELFSLVSCLRKFHFYIWGRVDTVIYTDHKPLTYIDTQPELTPTVQQWLDVLLNYKYEIRHRAGILHVAPDALSRMYYTAYSSAPRWGVLSAERMFAFAGTPSPDFSLQQLPDSQPTATLSIRMLTRREARQERQRVRFAETAAAQAAVVRAPALPLAEAPSSVQANLAVSPSSPAAVAAVLPSGGGVDSPEARPKIEPVDVQQLRPAQSDPDPPPLVGLAGAVPVHASSDAIIPVVQNVPFPENSDALRVAMELRGKSAPELQSDRIKLIRAEHDLGHFGREAIYKKLVAKDLWWPLMRSDIEQELRTCDDCLKYTIVKRGFHPAQFIHTAIPWDHVQIDTATNLPLSHDGKTVLLVIIDVCTGFVILRALPDKEMATTAKELWSVFSLLGLPRVIQSDNGTEFVNQLVKALIQLTGIDHRTIAEYNPRADGKVEHAVGTAKTVIMKRLHGHERLWTLYVDYTQLSINTKIAELTNTSPFALMLGRQCNPIRDYTQDPPLEVDLQAWTDHQHRIASVVLPAIGDRVLKIKDRQIALLNAKRRQIAPETFPPGAQVMVLNVDRKSKFDPRYIGPYQIERRSRTGTYVLRDAVGDILDRRVPADQIKLVSRVPVPRENLAHIYEVRRILAHRGEPGRFEYLIDWKGFGPEHQTWEPEDHVLHAAPAIAAYWSSQRSGATVPVRTVRHRRRAVAPSDIVNHRA